MHKNRLDSIHPVWQLGYLLLAACCVSIPAAAHADAPPAAGAAVVQLMEAVKVNDRPAYLASIADSYDFNSLKKATLDPFGIGWIVSDHLIYKIVQLQSKEAGVATALVDTQYTGRFNLGATQPSIVGSSRLWIEVRRQPDGDWRSTAIRPVRVHFTTVNWPHPFDLRHDGLVVNGQTSVLAKPDAGLLIDGRSTYGLPGVGRSYALHQFLQVGLNARPGFLQLGLVSQGGFARLIQERWITDLLAPTAPGRYFLDSTLFLEIARTDGGRDFSFDQMTIPVVVR